MEQGKAIGKPAGEPLFSEENLNKTNAKSSDPKQAEKTGKESEKGAVKDQPKGLPH